MYCIQLRFKYNYNYFENFHMNTKLIKYVESFIELIII